ncbi:TPA: hypothetical protein DEP21_01065 [Patescibacteria group bacterium]|nr:hypothetical protein [Candidatus Gracilibacteria bacterium]
MTYEDALTETVSQITDDYSSSRMKSFFVNNLTLIVVISLVVIALIVLTILYRKKIMFYIHKKPV